MNKRIEELHKVQQAQNLLEMLDFVMGTFALGKERGKPAPWGGMKATVEHLSEHLRELEQLLRQAPVASLLGSEPQDGSSKESLESPNIAGNSPVGSSLAGRIQMAPQPRAARRGYSREITSNEPIGEREPASAE